MQATVKVTPTQRPGVPCTGTSLETRSSQVPQCTRQEPDQKGSPRRLSRAPSPLVGVSLYHSEGSSSQRMHRRCFGALCGARCIGRFSRRARPPTSQSCADSVGGDPFSFSRGGWKGIRCTSLPQRSFSRSVCSWCVWGEGGLVRVLALIIVLRGTAPRERPAIIRALAELFPAQPARHQLGRRRSK